MLYQTGGSLPSDFTAYVVRKADEELYKNCKAANFCYVLTARQMGKSSMRVRVMERLLGEGFLCVAIDITAIGSQNATVEQWYYSFANHIARATGLSSKLRTWWKEQIELSPVLRLGKFMEDVVLVEKTERIVVFVDEIDSVLSLDKQLFSADDFFALIRALFNGRVDNDALKRLSFVVIGVAAPSDLISDNSRTPFNIGVPVNLTNFTYEEAIPLAKGLEIKGEGLENSETPLTPNPYTLTPNPQPLTSIMDWTGGQPYLTQKLCETIAAETQTNTQITNVPEFVAQVATRLFLSEAGNTDHNLANVNNRIVFNTQYNARMLGIYRQVLTGAAVQANNADNAQLYLKLAGIVVERGGVLVVANRIYQQKFNLAWITDALGKIDRPFAKDLQRWLELNKATEAALKGAVLEKATTWSATRDDLTVDEKEFIDFSRNLQLQEKEAEIARQLAENKRLIKERRTIRIVSIIAIIMFIIAAILAFWAYNQKGRAENNATIANQEKAKADSLAKIALKAKANADSNYTVAKTEKDRAEQLYKQVQQEKNATEAEKQKALAAKNEAVKNYEDAKAQKDKADELLKTLNKGEEKGNLQFYEKYSEEGNKKFNDADYEEATIDYGLAKFSLDIKDTANISVITKMIETNQKCLALRKRGFDYYYDNQFEKAKPYFDSVLSINNNDRVSLFMIEYCKPMKEQFMVKVEGGTFTMGRSYNWDSKEWGNDSTNYNDELPPHQVTLTPYNISQYEVTNAQYARFLNEYAVKYKSTSISDSVNKYINLTGSYSTQMKSGIAFENNKYVVVKGYELRPVVYVSWYGANEYCKFYGLQLPTEAQWEFAARGGKNPAGFENPQGLKYAGNDNIEKVAWYAQNSNSQTQVVGLKKQNQLEIYDMSGNVWEWCSDWYNENYYKNSPENNPLCADSGSNRVLRGGSWNSNAQNCRVADRYDNAPGDRSIGCGFRLVLVP